jgi:hypothetical protein
VSRSGDGEVTMVIGCNEIGVQNMVGVFAQKLGRRAPVIRRRDAWAP